MVLALGIDITTCGTSIAHGIGTQFVICTWFLPMVFGISLLSTLF